MVGLGFTEEWRLLDLEQKALHEEVMEEIKGIVVSLEAERQQNGSVGRPSDLFFEAIGNEVERKKEITNSELNSEAREGRIEKAVGKNECLDRVVTEPTNFSRVEKKPQGPQRKPPIRQIKQEMDKIAIPLGNEPHLATGCNLPSAQLDQPRFQALGTRFESSARATSKRSSDPNLNSWSEKERALFCAVILLLDEDQRHERISRNAWSFAGVFQLEMIIQGSPRMAHP
ncbi:hypothetical protein L345_14276, partial [Ophiophagus hannah]